MLLKGLLKVPLRNLAQYNGRNHLFHAIKSEKRLMSPTIVKADEMRITTILCNWSLVKEVQVLIVALGPIQCYSKTEHWMLHMG